MTHVLLRDYEGRSRVDIKKVGAALYAADPSTEATLLSFAIDDEPVQYCIPGRDPIPEVFFEAARNPAWRIAAHNDFFDSSLEESNLAPRLGWPLVPLDRHFCTMALARFHGLPGSLEAVANILKLPARKDMAGRKLMLKLCKPGKDGRFIEPTPEEWKYFVAYGMRDTDTARAVMRALPPLPESEQALWCLDQEVNRRGFTGDAPLATTAVELVEKAKARINARMAEVTGGAVEGTTKLGALREFVNGRGHKMTKTDKRAVAQVLAHDPDAAVREVLELRKAGANTAVEKYRALLACAFPDHRIRGLLTYYGTITGRWSSSGLNIHNMPREGNVDTAAAIAAIQSGDLDRVCAVGSPLDVLAAAMRGLVIAAAGLQLLIGDFATIEPRLGAWVSDATDDLDHFREFDRTGDPVLDHYQTLGARMCGRLVDPEDSEARQRGKTATMAFQYGGTVVTWRKGVPNDPRSDEEIMLQEVGKFRELRPAQTRFMFDLDRQALACVHTRKPIVRKRHSFTMDGDTLLLHLPSGRALSYRNAHIRPGKFGKDVVAYHSPGENKVEDLWYGALMAHLISGTARDLLTNALTRLDAAGFDIVLHVHDEVVAEVVAGTADVERFKACMLDAPEWAAGLPLAVKVRTDSRYIKTAENASDASEIEIEAPAEIEEALDDIEAPFEIEAPIAAAAVQASNDWSVPHAGSIVDALLREHAAKNQTNGSGNGHADWRENYAAGESTTGTAASSYVYLAADGTPHMKVVRTTAKQFPTYHWDKGHWSKGWPSQVVPYHLPELLNAPADTIVLICEGEKDCDTAAAAGLVATTNPGGAGKWRPELTAHFQGRQRVCIVEDNDAAGAGHAALVAKALAGIVPRIGVLRFPELPPGGDLSDYFNAGGGEPYLRARIEQAMQAADPQLLRFPFIDMSRWDHEPVPEPQYTVPGRIPRRQSVIFSGEGGAGKSASLLHLSAAAVLARDWLGATPVQGPALFIDCEDDQDVMHYRLAAIARHYGVKFDDLIRSGLHLTSLVGQDTVLATVSRSGLVEPTALYNRLLQEVGDIKPVLIGIAATANIFAGNENDRSQVQQFVNLTTRLAIVSNGSVVLISHPSLTGISSGTGLSGSTQWHNAVRARFLLKNPRAASDPEADSTLRELEFKKNQYGALTESLLLRWQDGMFLPVGETGTGDRATRDAIADEVFLELLHRFTTQNRHASGSSGTTFAPALFAKEDIACRAGISKAGLAAAMRRLFAADKIYNVNHGKDGQPRFHLVIKSGGDVK